MSTSDIAHPAALITDYAAWLELNDMSPRTIEQRTEFAERLLREHGTLVLTREQAVSWLRHYQGWTRLTYHNDLASVSKWLVEAGHATVNPVEGLRRSAPPRPRPNPLTEAEVAAALGAATGNTRAYLLLGLYAGLRCFEIAKFRGEEITSRHITLFGKGGQGAMIPTHPILWELAQDYPSRGYWFATETARGHLTPMAIQQAIYALYKPLGITGNIHRTRATYGTRLIRSGANIRIVQELMRHRSLQSTEHYLAAANDELGQAIRDLPPAA